MITNQTEAKKSRWGWGIAGLYVGFVAFMLTLVTFASLQHFDLVDKDYYAQELKYQNQIQRIEQTAHLATTVSFEIAPNGSELTLIFPLDSTGAPISGSVRFFRPSNAALDTTVILDVNPDGLCSVDISGLRSGNWKMQITWRQGTLEYYSEQSLYIE